jgi:TPR repeat protein
MRVGILVIVLSGCGPKLPTSQPAAEYFASERRQPESMKARECQAGNAQACTKLAFTFHSPGKAGGDPRGALPFHTRGCNLGSEVSCYNLGFQYWRGKGVDADAAHAARLFRRACLLGLHDGCNAARRAEADALPQPAEEPGVP